MIAICLRVSHIFCSSSLREIYCCERYEFLKFLWSIRFVSSSDDHACQFVNFHDQNVQKTFKLGRLVVVHRDGRNLWSLNTMAHAISYIRGQTIAEICQVYAFFHILVLAISQINAHGRREWN